MTTTTLTIDCQTCPARGRLCGDCFVPVLGRTWVEAPTLAPRREPVPQPPGPEHTVPDLAPLDTDELAAVSAFVRAGLVAPDEAAGARAVLTAGARSAAG